VRQRLLDTDTMSFILKDRFGVADKARAYIREHGPIAISTITCYEILRGLRYAGAMHKLAAFERFMAANTILPFDLPACRKAAEIYAALRQEGQLLEDADILISSIALANNCVLVTNNTHHYARVPGLELENWVA